MSEITIRPATIDDISVLRHHRRMMWWEMGRRDETQLQMMDRAAEEYFRSAVPGETYRGFLAANQTGEVIGGGGIVISPWPGTLGQGSPRRAMILNMYVEASYRRRGIARALMQAMIAWCRENGFAHVGLHASDDGRPLYEKLGFKPTSEMRLELTVKSDLVPR